MPISERSSLLIQKTLDRLITDAELAELEGLISTDPVVAEAYARAMRLDECLKVHFQRQYKIDQISRLLDKDNAGSRGEGPDAAPAPADSVRSAAPTNSSGSTFVPQRGAPVEPRRPRTLPLVLRLPRVPARTKWIAAAVLLLATGTAAWFAFPGGSAAGPRVASGRIVVLGRPVIRVPQGEWFEVDERNGAVLELAGGSRIELANSTQGRFHRNAGRGVLQLLRGGGKFHLASGGQPSLWVETRLGRVSATDGRFSLILTGTSDVQFSTEPKTPPQLTIAVVSGTVLIERDGVVTTLSAGDERTFL